MKRMYMSLAVVLLMVITSCGGGGGAAAPAPLSSAKEITTFSIAGSVGTIDEAGKTIVVGNMPFGTNVTVLAATFTTTGASVKVGSIAQISGMTANNFTAPVTYTVTAADNTSVTYTVTVTVAATLASLPQTGQTTCYDASNNPLSSCANTGQDGALQMGVAWPNPRFIDNGDQTITDNLTGLMWTQDGNAPGPAGCTPGVTKVWQDALDYAACLNTNNYLGHNDWRLPNKEELHSLANYGQNDLAIWLNAQGFMNVQDSWYYSSTTHASSTNAAWTVFMSNGNVFAYAKTTSSYYAWPVRTGQPGSVNLPETGQTTCYDASGNVISCTNTGQDGDLQKGVVWPNPRFTDNGDQTITDNLTGLMWTKDGNAPGPAGCTPGVAKTWQDALNYAACLNTNNYLGHNDWRLPNANELESMVNDGQFNMATWLNTQGFSNVPQATWYHSSTTYPPLTASEWVVSTGDGGVYVVNSSKNSIFYVWPVRAVH